MVSKLSKALKMKNSPVAVIITDNRPAEGTHFKEGRRGCAGNMLVASSKGRTAFFSRTAFGCPGGGEPAWGLAISTRIFRSITFYPPAQLN
ncbi:MAG TPA: DUF169 domain-containing protein [Syntrophomonadaceae bacterium]|nr:DUF169 domain-containing protein [Syntrophomonadaceae bacterium]